MRRKWLHRGGLPEPTLRGTHRRPRRKAAPLERQPTTAGDELLWPTALAVAKALGGLSWRVVARMVIWAFSAALLLSLLHLWQR